MQVGSVSEFRVAFFVPSLPFLYSLNSLRATVALCNVTYRSIAGFEHQ